MAFKDEWIDKTEKDDLDANHLNELADGIINNENSIVQLRKIINDIPKNDIDQTYNPESENAQSGKAVAEGIKAKTADMNKEAYLQFGGKNLDGAQSPIDALINSDHYVNRFSCMPADWITIEEEANEKITQYQTSDKVKQNFFTNGTAQRLYDITENKILRIRVKNKSFYEGGNFYCSINKIIFKILRSRCECNCKIYGITYGGGIQDICDYVVDNATPSFQTINTSFLWGCQTQDQTKNVEELVFEYRAFNLGQNPSLVVWGASCFGTNVYDGGNPMQKAGVPYEVDGSGNVKLMGELQGGALPLPFGIYDCRFDIDSVGSYYVADMFEKVVGNDVNLSADSVCMYIPITTFCFGETTDTNYPINNEAYLMGITDGKADIIFAEEKLRKCSLYFRLLIMNK